MKKSFHCVVPSNLRECSGILLAGVLELNSFFGSTCVGLVMPAILGPGIGVVESNNFSGFAVVCLAMPVTLGPGMGVVELDFFGFAGICRAMPVTLDPGNGGVGWYGYHGEYS